MSLLLNYNISPLKQNIKLGLSSSPGIEISNGY